MEFVLVTFPRVRSVRMDGATQGQTGQVIAVQRGVHIFDLGSPLDYTPPSVQTPVANTTSGAPLVVAFQSATSAPPLGSPTPSEEIASAVPATGGGAPTTARTTVRRTKAVSKRRAASKKKTLSKKKAVSKKSNASKKKTASRRKLAKRKRVEKTP